MLYNDCYEILRINAKGGRCLFNMDMGELLLVLLVAFLVVGPKDLPKVARWIARQIKKLKRLVNEVKTETGWDEFSKELKDTKADLEKTVREADIEGEIKQVSQELKQETETLQRELDQASEEARAAMKNE